MNLQLTLHADITRSAMWAVILGALPKHKIRISHNYNAYIQ